MPTVPAAHVRISGLAVAGPTGHASPTVIPWTRVGEIARLFFDARAEVPTGRVRILGGRRAHDLAQQLQLRALTRDLRNNNARWRSHIPKRRARSMRLLWITLAAVAAMAIVHGYAVDSAITGLFSMLVLLILIACHHAANARHRFVLRGSELIHQRRPGAQVQRWHITDLYPNRLRHAFAPARSRLAENLARWSRGGRSTYNAHNQQRTRRRDRIALAVGVPVFLGAMTLAWLYLDIDDGLIFSFIATNAALVAAVAAAAVWLHLKLTSD